MRSTAVPMPATTSAEASGPAIGGNAASRLGRRVATAARATRAAGPGASSAVVTGGLRARSAPAASTLPRRSASRARSCGVDRPEQLGPNENDDDQDAIEDGVLELRADVAAEERLEDADRQAGDHRPARTREA